MLEVFESEACRVWTGSVGTPLHAIGTVHEHEMEVIPFSVQIWLKKEPTVASVADKSPVQEGLYLVQTRAVCTHLQPVYTILLPLDAFSFFSIHRFVCVQCAPLVVTV